MLWLLLILIALFIIIVFVRFAPPATRPLTPERRQEVERLIGELQHCLERSAHVPANDLLGGLRAMRLGGILVRDQDANALTRGRRTHLTEYFFQQKTRCQQCYTLLWEAMRVAGNYVETDDHAAYEAATRDVERAFAAIAPCLGCEWDLPPGLPTVRPPSSPPQIPA